MKPSNKKNTSVKSRDLFRLSVGLVITAGIPILLIYLSSLYSPPAHHTLFRGFMKTPAIHWFLTPMDLTPERRLPVVRSSLHDVAIRGDIVWVVGSGGLVMRSNDSGMTWEDTVLSFSYSNIRSKIHKADAINHWRVKASVNANEAKMNMQKMKKALDIHSTPISPVPNPFADTGAFTPDWNGVFADPAFREAWIAGSGIIANSFYSGREWNIDTVIRDQAIEIGRVPFKSLTIRNADGKTWLLTSIYPDSISFKLRGHFAYVPSEQEWKTIPILQSARKAADNTSLLSVYPEDLDGNSSSANFRRFAAGTNGCILISDNGSDWRPVKTHIKDSLYAVAASFSSAPGLVFAVGSNGTIIRSRDNGETWTRLTCPPSEASKKPWPLLPAPSFYVMIAFAVVIGMRFSRRGPQAPVEQSVANLLVSDRPLRSGDPDPLNFGRIAKGLSMFIRNRNCKPPLTIAITGEWGKGKSSIMNLLKADLDRTRFPAVWFNAWHHEQEENILASLLENIRSQAIPPAWTLIGLGFRLRLWSKRLRRNAAPLITALLALTVAAGMLHWENGLAATMSLENLTNLISSIKESQKFDEKGIDLLAQLGGLGALVSLLYTVLRMIKVFGIKPSTLASRLKGRVSAKDLDELVGFKYKFSQDFSEVTRALGNRNMTIIIDDLDRCGEQSVAEVLEFVNFLATCGDVFIVLGMNSDYVKCCVAEQFKDIAIRYFDLRYPDRKSSTEDVDKYLSFAGDYLEKLINIQIDVPTPDKAALGRIGIDDEPESKALRGCMHTDAGVLQKILEFSLTVAFACLLFFVAFKAGGILAPEKDPPPPAVGEKSIAKKDSASSAGQTISVNNTAGFDTTNTTAGSDTTDIIKALATMSSKAAKIDKPIHTQSFPVFEILFTLLLFAAVFVLRMTNRSGDIVRDSPAFIRALQEWNDLLCIICQTPRGIKKFHNRVRYLAMMLRSPVEQTRVERIMVSSGKFLDRISSFLGRPPYFSQRWGLSSDHSSTQAGLALPEDVLVGLCVVECYDRELLSNQDSFSAEFLKSLDIHMRSADINIEKIAALISDQAVQRYLPTFRALTNGITDVNEVVNQADESLEVQMAK